MLYYLTELLKRFHYLLIKLMSIKVIVLGLATWLLLAEVLPALYWFLCALALLSFRTFEKWVGGMIDTKGLSNHRPTPRREEPTSPSV